MSEQQADVVVIGLGPGGEHTAARLAEAGLDVVGIEADSSAASARTGAVSPAR
jgi:flavin-dependent dehydrogenase